MHMKNLVTANLQEIINLESAAELTQCTVEPTPTLDRKYFTSALRNVASSVSVVTTDGVAGKHGGTVSSFCSVSADPPTMLVCLNRDSKIAKVVADNGCFNINVLCQGDSHIANRFAGLHDAQVNDRFTDIAHSHTPTGPVLESAATLSCTVQKVVCSGSHDVIFGLVQAVQISSAKPLAYCDGAYRRVIAEPPNDFKTGK